MWQIVAWSLGLLLQLAGVFIAFVGVVTTQRDYKSPSEPWMFDWVFVTGRWLARAYRTAIRWMRGLVSRGRQDAVVPAPAVGGYAKATSKVAGSVQVTYGPLPDDVSDDEKLRLLDVRTRQDRESINRIERDLFVQLGRFSKLDAALDSRTEQVRNEAFGSLRLFATRGLTAAAWGLGMTFLGIILGALAALPRG